MSVRPPSEAAVGPVRRPLSPPGVHFQVGVVPQHAHRQQRSRSRRSSRRSPFGPAGAPRCPRWSNGAHRASLPNVAAVAGLCRWRRKGSGTTSRPRGQAAPITGGTERLRGGRHDAERRAVWEDEPSRRRRSGAFAGRTSPSWARSDRRMSALEQTSLGSHRVAPPTSMYSMKRTSPPRSWRTRQGRPARRH